MNTETKPVESLPVVAWEVDIHSMTCIVFATTKAKAQWRAVASFWGAGYGRKGEWPRAKATRRPAYDDSPLKNYRQQAWTEDHVRTYPMTPEPSSET